SMTTIHHLNADQNIQYRILVACIKERLFPEQTAVQYEKDKLVIQLHQHILHVACVAKSMLFQFELEGPIYEKVNHEDIEVQTVEELLAILEGKFGIEFHEQLVKELLHSRLGLELSYQQLRQRQNMMRHSLKFSRMPESLNFIAWLNHINDDSDFSALGYTEGMVWNGHPSHPLTKTKLPLTVDEIQKYA
ncbi:siderophore synthetase, partial [Staphylococcus chromogenes]|nr:siderophore synthetase [Staphylococcus chromogenes]